MAKKRQTRSKTASKKKSVTKRTKSTILDLESSATTAVESNNPSDPNALLLEVLIAFSKGDFSRRMPLSERGLTGKIYDTLNSILDREENLTQEIVRISEVVGREGRFSQRMTQVGMSGGWNAKVNAINTLIDDLVQPSSEVTRVITAVASGDLTQKMALEIEGQPVTGEFLQAANNLNTMVDQLNSFAGEVTRIATEVGTDGKLGGQAQVEGVSGTWRDLTNSVNVLAQNLTDQVRDIAKVTTAVANGDLSQKITVDVRGEVNELKETINTMVDQLRAFSGEVTRMAREVGTEGKLGGQARVEGVSGAWLELTNNVNAMASNLTVQVRDIAVVLTAVANGDLNKKITVEVQGEVDDLKQTINNMVDRLNIFADEVSRVAREVGTDGNLGGQATVEGAAGSWRVLTDNVNILAQNLTDQVRDIAKVTTAVANGDLSQKITVEVRGEVDELKQTINTMVDQLNAFSGEVTRVAQEVGTDGVLGGQAEVKGAQGDWLDLTNNVNTMASNLTTQVRNVVEVVTAVAEGDLSKKITIAAKGEVAELADTINTMVDQLSAFSSEVTRVAREVGTEGVLGGQAKVDGASGEWLDLTNNVNAMAGNLTSQVRDIAVVTTAVANGDLSKKITIETKGEVALLADTINTMVDQLSVFSSEVTRVAREVGTEGVLGGQATVEGVRGEWLDLTNNVNAMAGNLTSQVRDIAVVTTAVANGDLSKKITIETKGEVALLADTINTMVDQLSNFSSEVARVAGEVGTQGVLGGQADVKGVSGEWLNLTNNVNAMAGNLTSQVRDIARVATAVAAGDLSKKITVEVSGEILELKDTINTMVDQLNTFADEVTRVALEVGTEGKLGAQAEVSVASGRWRDLTDSVNTMCSNLTDQVRGVGKVVTAVAQGDLTQEVKLEARGEVEELAVVINGMIRTLSTFSDQVSGVAREVGVEGKLGGRADVPGAAGTWRSLTDNVNELAGNLTRQVRAIADVATAVTKGDLSQTIEVEASGEVAALSDNINQMILSLAGTSETNTEQDWLKTSLATCTRITTGANELKSVAETLLQALAPMLAIQHGIIYLAESDENQPVQMRLAATYAFKERKNLSNVYRLGEGLVGQCAVEKKRIVITDVPGDYVQISSGLGSAAPMNIVVLPVLFEDELMAVIELASFGRFTEIQTDFLDQLTESLGVGFNAILATQRNEELLSRSQSMTEELQTQQEELQQTNEELEEKARLVEQQKLEVELKNEEVESAKLDIEDKVKQLELTSRYKSEFLANMSHELRTPLNSLLILSQTLSKNPDKNLTSKQVEYAETIHGSGADLLNLINEILDLSKIESGMMALEARETPFEDIAQKVERNFRQIAKEKDLDFDIGLDSGLPHSIYTDPARLQQVLKNLLSNAFKFTEQGKVAVEIAPATEGWSASIDSLNRADLVVAFEVSDTGIGIPKDKQRLIFEAFQQADGGTSRKYGGTGLGLSISREIARLLGGEIRLASEQGAGSTFTLYLPIHYWEPDNQNVESGWFRDFPSDPSGRQGQSKVIAAVTSKRSAAVKAKIENGMKTGNGGQTEVRALLPFDDDRNDIQPGDRVVLIVEDDVNFAKIMMEVARGQGFKTLVAMTGASAISLVREFRPDAVSLDIELPDIDGWQVLDRLKHDPDLRHIPVHIVSASDGLERGLKQGAVACFAKPVDQQKLADAFANLEQFLERKVKELLIVEDDEAQREFLVDLIGNGDVHTTAVGTGEQALAALADAPFECMVVDLNLPDMSGFELIKTIQEDPDLTKLPIIVYTARDLTPEEETQLRSVTETIIVKDVKSPDRLLDETALFLHRVQANLPEEKQEMIKQVRENDLTLAGRTVLIVDDDMRNIFALTSVLERHEMDIVFADNGKAGIEKLRNTPGVEIVLMDIMMPDMDGYEAIAAIRRIPQFQKLPVIALTAKAMKGDREKCIAAGASDYISKPVDMDQLLSLMRVWLYR